MARGREGCRINVQSGLRQVALGRVLQEFGAMRTGPQILSIHVFSDAPKPCSDQLGPWKYGGFPKLGVPFLGSLS